MRKAVVGIMVVTILLFLGSPALAAKKDTINPFITNTDPFDGQHNVLTDNRITLQFNERLLKGSRVAQIRITESEQTTIGYTYDLQDNIIRLTTKKKMKPGTSYRVTVPSTSVRDYVGNFMKEDFVFVFVTESAEAANGSEALTQEENISTHRIIIDAVMEEELSSEEEAYLIAAWKAIGVQIKQISVNKAVEAETEVEEEKPEETVEAEQNPAEEVAEETEVSISYDVYLVECGHNKVGVIRVIRYLTGLDLAAAKRLADNSDITPQLIAEGISDADARTAGKKLEEAGAVVLITEHEESTD